MISPATSTRSTKILVIPKISLSSTYKWDSIELLKGMQNLLAMLLILLLCLKSDLTIGGLALELSPMKTFLQVLPLREPPAPLALAPSLTSLAFDNFQHKQL